jgi:ABC-2 type transport system ATP-binding protein
VKNGLASKEVVRLPAGVLTKDERSVAPRRRPPRLAEPARVSGLRLDRASKRFGKVQALDGCSFAVEPGRMLGFLGPNGAGKTTAMRSVFDLVRLDSGRVLWGGRPIRRAERLRFGYMPEERGLYPRMPVAEQLVYFGRLHGMDERAARAAVQKWLERLGLRGRGDSKVEELSHGNQQRAQLAAALLHEPDLLVLDEPFAGLDPVAVQTLADVLRSEAGRGAAVLFSSHQLELVEHICEEVAIVDHGRIVATGAVDELKRASQRRRVELQLDVAPPEWLPDVAGVELVERRNGTLRLLAGTGVDPEEILASARQTGRVVAFTYGPPSLAELFLELVGR